MTYQLERTLERHNENIQDSVFQVRVYLNEGGGYLLNTEVLNQMCENIQTTDLPSAVRHLKKAKILIMELETIVKLEEKRRMRSSVLEEEQKRGNVRKELKVARKKERAEKLRVNPYTIETRRRTNGIAGITASTSELETSTPETSGHPHND